VQNTRRSTPQLMALVAALVLLIGVDQSDVDAGSTPEQSTPDLPVVLFLLPNGDSVPLSVEIADTPELAQCGLMHRNFMPEEQGMLFVYEGRNGFWNRNTLIPLSVAYISHDGRIVDILPMDATPFAGAPGVIQPDPQEPYSFVVEANAGWFERHGILIGDYVDVADAVARGSEGQPPPLCRELGY
jgi:uncharacterized membrane protein (UPF0127 family)